jgi:hypothetical protein
MKKNKQIPATEAQRARALSNANRHAAEFLTLINSRIPEGKTVRECFSAQELEALAEEVGFSDEDRRLLEAERIAQEIK